MKLLGQVVALVLLLVAVRFAVRQFREGRGDVRVRSAEYLQTVVDDYNRQMPRRIDDDVELMSLAAEEATLLFNYRLLNYDGSNVMVNAVRDEVVKAACADTIVRRQLLRRGIGVKLQVHDKYGLKATTFAVLPNSC